MTKRFFIDQHGCAKNQVDAEIINGILKEINWIRTDDPDMADLFIVNSCGFIDSAKTESLNAVLNIRKQYPKKKILLAGCLAERYANILQKELPEADAFFGNGDLSKLPSIVKTMFFIPHKKSIMRPEQKGISCGLRPEVFNFPRSVYIKITEGCDNCCSFCAIPLIRGHLRSRSVKSIIEEISNFIKLNYYEFNLIGQDLAAFRTDSTFACSGLSILLSEISKLKGNFRIRLLYIHPDHFPQDILPIMTDDTRFLPYFDIPFQSGSERIIKAMNRKGSPEEYLSLIKKIKNAFAEKNNPYKTVVFRTTFLTGFPGETDEEFLQTAEFLKKSACLWSGTFAYSREDDTAAFFMKKQIPKRVKEKRRDILQDIQSEISTGLLKFFIGSLITVLVEELIPANTESEDGDFKLALGRAWFQAPEVDGSVVLSYTDDNTDMTDAAIKEGSLVCAKVINVSENSLSATASLK